MSKSEINMKLVYTLMAIFSLSLKPKSKSQLLFTLCEVAEEATGEPFSTEVLEERIEKISKFSLEDKIEVTKIIQKFLSIIKLGRVANPEL